MLLCPLQGEGYLPLVQFAFLDGPEAELTTRAAYLKQALAVRPYHGDVLRTAGVVALDEVKAMKEASEALQAAFLTGEINQTEFVREKFVGHLRQLNFEPGTDTVYTNVGFILLGVVVETVTGRSYESYVRDNILVPLGMTDTVFVRSPEQQERTAVGSMPVLNMYSALMWIFGDDHFFEDYVQEKSDGRFWMKPLYTDYTPSTGLSGPAEDLAAFGQFLMSGTAPNGVGILEPSTIEAMQIMVPLEELPARYRKVHNFSFGLKAWKIDERRVYGHSGGGPGFGAIMAFLPEEQIVVAVNAADTSIDRDELLRVLTSVNW